MYQDVFAQVLCKVDSDSSDLVQGSCLVAVLVGLEIPSPRRCDDSDVLMSWDKGGGPGCAAGLWALGDGDGHHDLSERVVRGVSKLPGSQTLTGNLGRMRRVAGDSQARPPPI
jgi:hypothetical protein